MSRTRKALRSLVVLSLVAFVGWGVTHAAFSGTTSNTSNTFSAGSVAVGDNDVGGAVLSLSNARPNDSDDGCLKVTYTGSLASSVRMWSSVSGSLAPYVSLKVIRGTDSTPSFPACTNFTPDGTDYIGAGNGVVYDGLLSGFPTSYAGGLVEPKAATPESWTNGEAHSYRFVVTLNDNAAAQGLSSTATFNWEARNE